MDNLAVGSAQYRRQGQSAPDWGFPVDVVVEDGGGPRSWTGPRRGRGRVLGAGAGADDFFGAGAADVLEGAEGVRDRGDVSEAFGQDGGVFDG